MEENKGHQKGASPRIVKLIIFARHGARHPIKIPENYKYYEIDESLAGKLTKAGKAQLKWLGMHVKNNLVPQMIKKDKYSLYVRSTETERTLNSTKNFLKGMMSFKGKEVKKEYENAIPSPKSRAVYFATKELTRNYSPTQDQDENAEYLNQLYKFIQCHKVTPNYKGVAFEEIPYHKTSYDFERSGFITHIEVLSKAHDKLLLQYKDPVLKKKIKKEVEKEKMQEMIHKKMDAEAENLKRELSKIVGSSVSLGDIKVISTLFDCHNANGVEMPPGVKKSIVLEAKKFASMTNKHKYSNKKLHFNAAGHLAQDVCNQLIEAVHQDDHEFVRTLVRQTTEDMKSMHKKESDICFYCAHHSTMQSLMYAFQLNKMPGFHSPGFGSHLIFELWSMNGDSEKIAKNDEKENPFFVKFYYNGEYLKDSFGEDCFKLDKILGISHKVIKNFDKHFLDFAPVKQAEDDEFKYIDLEDDETSDNDSPPTIQAPAKGTDLK